MVIDVTFATQWDTARPTAAFFSLHKSCGSLGTMIDRNQPIVVPIIWAFALSSLDCSNNQFIASQKRSVSRLDVVGFAATILIVWCHRCGNFADHLA